MVLIRLKTKGVNKLLRKLKGVTKEAVIKRSLTQGAFVLENWIKQNRLSGPRPKFLGVVTGRLRASISAKPAIKRGNRYFSTIGTNVGYARKHEFGEGVRARPFMRPALQARINQDKVLDLLVRNITRELKK